MVSENKNTEFKVLLQPETNLTELVSGFFFLNLLNLYGRTAHWQQMH